MGYFIWGVICLAGIQLVTHLFLIIKDYLAPDIVVKELANTCSEKDCAYYEVKKYSNSVQEDAVCHIAVRNFDKKYRGSSSCKKSTRYFGKSPEETYTLVKRRKRDFMNSIGSLTGYLALILSLYRIIESK